ncbi:AraC family transcriptional regulator [Nocardiopsis sp. NRRL B-16309]|uniref:AraC family transcriptional regulator n=1 Tax=Nocardiopsis sp. NRRL B-16309 TaxID=1519494 RepID=UPI0006AE751B|nr:AraC family transcriptional regulator [Nocardiopsis sp. NRRL B-16309]KOX15689.1 AraC family transcriptional regulator [Nocardiopsis sp. NRRL B-16309]
MLDRLNRALEMIEEDLGAPVDVAELARAALTSEYHFRRLFSALAGMPLSEYVRRRRLTLAGAEVVDGDDGLLDVAVRYGYGSTEAFARAFRAMHGVGPGQARRTGAVLTSQPRMTFRLTIEGSSAVRYRIVEKEAFRLVGVRARVPLVYEGENAAITAFVRAIDPATNEEIGRLSDQEPRGVVSVTDDVDAQRREGSELDYYRAAATCAAVPEGMDGLEVAAGTWAVFPSDEGPRTYPESLQRLWADAFAQWFPAHPGYRMVEGPSILRVDDGADPSAARAELWLPVERV